MAACSKSQVQQHGNCVNLSDGYVFGSHFSLDTSWEATQLIVLAANPKLDQETLHLDFSHFQTTLTTVLEQTWIYLLQCEWEEALKLMDHAVNDMPRTEHRLLVFCFSQVL